MLTKKIQLRFVDKFGETLIVRENNGVKALVDPCDDSVIVIVQTGRNAVLVNFAIGGAVRSCGRNALTRTVNPGGKLGFISVEHQAFLVFLQDLTEGQRVDVLPLPFGN